MMNDGGHVRMRNGDENNENGKSLKSHVDESGDSNDVMQEE